MLCTVANLDTPKLEAVQSLEKKLGRTLVAFSCKDIRVVNTLKEDEVAQIKQTEAKLGLALVAVE
jgi:hypothetical protein